VACGCTVTPTLFARAHECDGIIAALHEFPLFLAQRHPPALIAPFLGRVIQMCLRIGRLVDRAERRAFRPKFFWCWLARRYDRKYASALAATSACR
jgi:hypothetical protein